MFGYTTKGTGRPGETDNGICFPLSAANCLTKALRTLRRWRTLTRSCPIWDAISKHE